MHRKLALAALGAVSVLALNAAALAQPAANQPWSVEGRIENRDAREDDRRYDEHQVRLEAGQRYRLTADSEEFDPVLRLSSGTEVLAENDDGGESLNSRIIYIAPTSGTYTLRVRGYSTEARGAYRLGAELLPPLPPAAPIPLAPRTTTWTTVTGTLVEGASTPGNDYSLFLSAGEEVIIRLDGEFDTVIDLFRAADRDGDPIASDDDGGDGLNSLLVFRASETGEYIVRARALGEGGGAYRLRIGQ
jgi:hypothetical protein